MELIFQSLSERWFRFTAGNIISENVRKDIFNMLISHYQEPGRFYHTHTHLYRMFKWFDEYLLNQSQNTVSDELQWAIWFHDIVYQPLSKDNEEQSSELMIKYLSLAPLSQTKTDCIKQLIMSTTFHTAFDTETALLIDLDLTILGESPEIYQRYALDIRKEYHQISEDEYILGRKKVLNRFLEREKLYFTPFFSDTLELCARKNITEELKSL